MNKSTHKPPRIGGLFLLPLLIVMEWDYALGLAAIMMLGRLDDIYNLRPHTKLIVEFIVAFLVTNTIYQTVWLVFMMNAMNLSDNMDGLAPGLAYAAACFYQDVLLVVLLLPVLLLNWFPKRPLIYLGDFGALSLGFILGLHSLTHQLGPLPLWIPIVDTIFVAISRPLRGRSLFRGGRDHLSHRLATRVGKEWGVLILVLGGALGTWLVGVL